MRAKGNHADINVFAGSLGADGRAGRSIRHDARRYLNPVDIEPEVVDVIRVSSGKICAKLRNGRVIKLSRWILGIRDRHPIQAERVAAETLVTVVHHDSHLCINRTGQWRKKTRRRYRDGCAAGIAVLHPVIHHQVAKELAVVLVDNHHAPAAPIVCADIRLHVSDGVNACATNAYHVCDIGKPLVLIVGAGIKHTRADRHIAEGTWRAEKRLISRRIGGFGAPIQPRKQHGRSWRHTQRR